MILSPQKKFLGFKSSLKLIEIAPLSYYRSFNKWKFTYYLSHVLKMNKNLFIT